MAFHFFPGTNNKNTFENTIPHRRPSYFIVLLIKPEAKKEKNWAVIVSLMSMDLNEKDWERHKRRTKKVSSLGKTGHPHHHHHVLI